MTQIQDHFLELGWVQGRDHDVFSFAESLASERSPISILACRHRGFSPQPILLKGLSKDQQSLRFQLQPCEAVAIDAQRIKPNGFSGPVPESLEVRRFDAANEGEKEPLPVNESAPDWMQDPPSSREEITKYFTTHGFVRLRRFFEVTEVKQIGDRLLRYQREVAPRLPASEAIPSPRGDGSYLTLQQIDAHDPFFADLMHDSRLQDLASLLLRMEVKARHIQFFNLSPNFSKPTPPHQDDLIFSTRAGHLLTVWMPMSQVNRSNGCLHYIPGSHHWGRRRHHIDPSGSWRLENYGKAERAQEVALTAECGDILVHHGRTIHCSEANRTNQQRFALAIPFLAEDQEYFKSRAEWISTAL